jgi:hypothetical protein
MDHGRPLIRDPCCGITYRQCSTAEHRIFKQSAFCSDLHEGTVLAEKKSAHAKRYLKQMKEYPKPMIKKVSFAAIFSALALFVAAPLAHATTVSEVQSMITQLKGKVQIIQINGKNAETKDRPGLLGQLDGVALTLDQGKFCDSVTKVRDFQKKVNAMISADNKINQDPTVGVTAQELITDGDAIITALNELSTQSKGSACTF